MCLIEMFHNYLIIVSLIIQVILEERRVAEHHVVAVGIERSQQ